jgi:hypothetical protein
MKIIEPETGRVMKEPAGDSADEKSADTTSSEPVPAEEKRADVLSDDLSEDIKPIEENEEKSTGVI